MFVCLESLDANMAKIMGNKWFTEHIYIYIYIFFFCGGQLILYILFVWERIGPMAQYPVQG